MFDDQMERRCLAYDPFAGDFGSTDDRTLSDRFVVAAKTHEKSCHCCLGNILKGERHRPLVGVFEGQLMAFRWCGECCSAQAQSQDDDGAAVEARLFLYGQSAA